jgi:5-hydroxyisourate hydrolase
MSAITTHVLDTAKGCPATGVPITLEQLLESGWKGIGAGVTDSDGRCRNLLTKDFTLSSGQYRITFHTQTYFGDQPAFYPSVTVLFTVPDSSAHYHVPLLLSPYGYSTYRGT